MHSGTTMTYSTKITRKGQTTIPIQLRRLLNLKEGQYVNFRYDKTDNSLHLEPAAGLESLIGLFPTTKKYDRDKAHKDFIADMVNRQF